MIAVDCKLCSTQRSSIAFVRSLNQDGSSILYCSHQASFVTAYCTVLNFPDKPLTKVLAGFNDRGLWELGNSVSELPEDCFIAHLSLKVTFPLVSGKA